MGVTLASLEDRDPRVSDGTFIRRGRWRERAVSRARFATTSDVLALLEAAERAAASVLVVVARGSPVTRLWLDVELHAQAERQRGGRRARRNGR